MIQMENILLSFNSESHEQPFHPTEFASSNENDHVNSQSSSSDDLSSTEHRSATPVPPQTHVEETSIPREDQYDVDVRHTDLTNHNVSSSIDVKQLNSDQSNNISSPPSTVRRNIFSEEQNNENQLPPPPHEYSSSYADQQRASSYSSSSSSRSRSSSPVSKQRQESFSSDSSVIDRNWIEENRQHDIKTCRVLPKTNCNSSSTKQVYSLNITKLNQYF